MTEVGWEGDPVGAITVADDTDSDDPAIRKLTAPAQDDVDMGPSWSPNGKQLAFLRFSYEGSAIYRVNVDGSGLRRLVGGSDIGSFGAPVWGPRSTNLITFVDHNDNCIHVVSPDGSNRRQVLCPKGRDGTPRAIQGLQWFPDGKHLLVCTYWDASVPANVRKVDVATGNPVAGFVRAMPGADQRFARRPATRAEERQEGRPCPGRRHWNKPVPDRRHQPGVLGRWQAGGFQKEVSNLLHPLFVIDTDGSDARQITPPPATANRSISGRCRPAPTTSRSSVNWRTAG